MGQDQGGRSDSTAVPARTDARRSRVRRRVVDGGLAAVILATLVPGVLTDRSHPALLVGLALLALLAVATRRPSVDRLLDQWLWVPGSLVTVLLVAGTGGHDSPMRVGFLVVAGYCALRLDTQRFAIAGVALGLGYLAPLAHDPASVARELLIEGVAYGAVTMSVRLLAQRSDERDPDRGRRAFLMVFENNPLPIVTMSLDEAVTWANRAAGELVGPARELLGRPVSTLVPAGDGRDALREAVDRARGGHLATVDLRLPREGRNHRLEITVTPLTDEDGTVVELVGTARDVTDRHLARQAILRRSVQRKSLAQFGMEALAGASLDELTARATKLIVQSLPADDSSVLVPVAGGNAITIRSYAGDEAEDWLGRMLPMQGSLGGQVFTTGEAFASGDFGTEQRFAIPSWLRNSSTRSGVAVPIHTEEGRWGVLAATCRQTRDWSEDDRTFVQSIANVLGSAVQREHAAQRLRHEEDRFRSLADNAQDIVFRVEMEPEARLTYISPSVEDVFGRSPQDLLEQPVVWLDAIDAELLALELPKGPAPFDRVANERIPVRHDDGHVVWLEVRRTPVRGTHGRVVAIDGIARDVTASQRSHAILEATLAQQQRVALELRQVDELRDNFLAAVSHELRTPLASVLGFAMTLESSRDRMEDAQVQVLLERLCANARRLDVLLGDLLDLDRMRRSVVELRRRTVDVTELVERVLQSRPDHDGRVIVDATSVLASVDPPMIERIVENLLANARRHGGQDATIWVRVTAEEHDLVIVVEDDGPGIPATLRETVFQPFEQGPHDQPHAPGTGIGLSLVAHFAALHGGTAVAAERPGGGASLRVCFPDAATVDATPHATQRPEPDASEPQPRIGR